MDNKSPVTGLLLLRTLQSNSSHIWFEDDKRVLCLQETDSTSIINIKCSSSLIAISEDELLADEDDFSIKKCFRDVVRLKNSVSTKTFSSEDIKNINYIVYTNRLIDSCKFLVKNDDKVTLLNSTSKYKLDVKAYFKSSKHSEHEYNFFVNFAEAVNIYYVIEQFSFNEINLKIENEISEFIKGLRLNTYNVNLISNLFVKYVSNTNELLTKNDICLKLCEILIRNYKTDKNEFQSNSNQLSNVLDVWKSILSNKSIVILDYDKTVLEILINYIGDHILLKINNVQEFDDLRTILNLCNFNINVIIVNNSGAKLEVNNVGVFSNLEDLSEDHKAEILQSKVSLQGRVLRDLGELIDKDMFKFINVGDIVRILQDSKSYTIGDKFEALPSYFIERSLFKIILSNKVLYEVRDEMFIILNQESSSNIFLKVLEEAKLTNIFFDESSVEQLKMEDKVIHWVNYHSDAELEWLASRGSVSKINSYIVTDETGFCTNVKHITKLNGNGNVRLISANSGLGCSVLLQTIAFNCSDAWCIHMKSDSLELHDNLTISNCTNLELSRAVFKKMKLVLLVDDFYPTSENTEFYKSQSEKGVTSYIVFASTLKEKLKESFGTFAYVLTSFTIPDQKNFLHKYYGSFSTDKSIIEEFSRVLLKIVEENLNYEHFYFANSPLRLKFLADIYISEFKSSLTTGAVTLEETFDLLNFYKEYLYKRCEKISLKVPEFGKIPINIHSLLALKTFFTQSDLEQLAIKDQLKEFKLDQLPSCGDIFNIDDEGETHEKFEHASFAEYFSALWISENIDKELGKQLYRLRFRNSGSLRNLYKFVDLMLAKDKPLHLLLISRKLFKLKTHLETRVDSAFEYDEHGRSIFHMAALYGVYHDQIPDNGVIEVHDELLQIVRDHFVQELATSHDWILNYTPLEYAVGSGALGIANIICEMLPEECIKTVIPDSYLEVCLSYCGRLDEYVFFLRTLLKSLACHVFYKEQIVFETSISEFLDILTTNEDIHMSVVAKLLQFDIKTMAELLEKFELKMPMKRFFHDLRLAAAFGNKDNIMQLICRGDSINNVGNYAPTALHYAVYYQKLENIDCLLQEGADINTFDMEGNTCLHIIILRNITNVKLFIKLLLRGADLNKTNINGDTPLHLALENNHTRIAEMLLPDALQDFYRLGLSHMLKLSDLEHYDINKQNSTGNTPLLLALAHDYLNIAKTLLKHGADRNITNNTGDSCLHYAVAAGYNPLVMDLIIKGADVNKRNAQDETPIIIACRVKAIKLANVLLNLCSKESLESTLYHSALYHAVDSENNDLVVALLNKGAKVNPQNNNDETPLIVAIKQWNVDAVLLLLERGADCNKLDVDGKSCLNYAVEKKNFTITNHLLNRGVDVNQKNSNGDTPIMVASEGNNIRIINLLLEKGADIFVSGDDGNTCLHYAAGGGYEELVLLFLSRGMNANLENLNGDTALSYAFQKCERGVCRLLMGKDADITVINNDECTCLHYAAQHGLLHLIVELVNGGADVNIRNNANQTPLAFFMNWYGDKSGAIKMMLCTKENYNDMDSSRNTCLHLAAQLGDDEDIIKLIEYGADGNELNEYHETPLFLATIKRRLSSVKLLLMYGANPNIPQTDTGNSPLHIAASYCDSVIAEELLKNGAVLDATNNSGETPLYESIGSLANNVTDLLLSHNADVNIRETNNGKTCLLLAIEDEHHSLVEELLKRGANVNAEDFERNTPVSCALHNFNLDLVETLKGHGAEVKTTNLNSALHRACAFGYLHLVERFLEDGAEINNENSEGETPLLVAIKEGYVGIANFLLEKGADITIKTSSADTCLHYAAKDGNSNFIKLFLEQGIEIDALNLHGKTALYVALESSKVHVMKLLLEKGADVRQVTEHCFLHEALNQDLFQIMEYLLDRCPDIDFKNNYGYTPLMEALRFKKLAFVRLLIQKGANIHCEDNSGYTCLHFVADTGLEDVLLELIELGAIVDKPNRDNSTPFTDALKQEHTYVAQILLKHGADLYSKYSQATYPIHLAASNGCYEVLEEILHANFPIEKLNGSGNTALSLALITRQLSCAKLLLEHGADFNVKQADNDSCLHFAVNEQLGEIVDYLIEKKVNANVLNYNMRVPLNMAAWRGFIDIAKSLLAYNIDANFIDEKGCTYLYYAAKIGDLTIVVDLINRGFDMNQSNNKGRTPLSAALKHGHWKVGKKLIELGANVNISSSPKYYTCVHYLAERGEHELIQHILEDGTFNINRETAQGETPLALAAQHKRMGTVKLLLAKGADPSITDANGYTCLHHASQCGAANIVEILAKVCDVNRQTYCNGRTPLLLALWKKHRRTAKILLENGAHCTIEDFKGCSALHAAVKLGNRELVIESLNQGCDINKLNKKRRSPLYLAIKYRKNHIAKLLIEFGGDVLAADSYEETCLHKAVQKGSEDVVADLIKAGADVNKHRNYAHDTPLHLAIENKSPIIARMLLEAGANPQLKNNQEYNALHCAAERGYDSIIPLLIEKGCDINEKIKSNHQTALVVALKQRKLTTAKILIEHGANVHLYYSEEFNPLFLACSLGDYQLVRELVGRDFLVNQRLFTKALKNNQVAIAKWLIEIGCELTTKNAQCTSFHHAVQSGLNEIVELLIEKGVDINLPNPTGATALHLALILGQMSTAKLLLSKGVDVTYADQLQPLLYHCRSNYGNVVEEILSKGVDINQFVSPYQTAIHMALKHNREDVARVLIDRGVYIHKTNSSGNSGLHCASKGGSEALVKLLIEKGADVNKRNVHRDTPLLNALKQRHAAIAKTLLKNGSSAKAINGQENTCLHYASQIGDDALVAELIDLGADVNHQNDKMHTALMLALSERKRSTAELLASSKNINVHLKEYNGTGHLHYAAKAGYDSVVNILIAAGINLNTQNDDGDTPLSLALKFNQASTAKLLLTKGANVLIENSKDTSYLHLAVPTQDEELVQLLMKKGVDIDVRNGEGNPPIALAFRYGNQKIVDLFLSKDANLLMENQSGCNLMHYAVRTCNVETLQELLKSIKSDTYNNVGDSPLSVAIFHKNLDVARFLLKEMISSGATRDMCLRHACEIGDLDMVVELMNDDLDLDQTNDDGDTPLGLALKNAHLQVARKLLGKGADVARTNYHGWTYLHYAATTGDDDLVLELINKGIDCNCKCNDGNTPLLLALQYHKMSTALLLIAEGANVNISNSSGTTCLYYAARLGADDVLKVLIEKGAAMNEMNDYFTPLLFAVCNKQISAAKLLLRSGACVLCKYDNNNVILHYAAKNGLYEVLLELLPLCKALINETNNSDQTPLQYAIKDKVFFNKLDVDRQLCTIKLLLQNGANAYHADSSEKLALDHAKDLLKRKDVEAHKEMYTYFYEQVSALLLN